MTPNERPILYLANHSVLEYDEVQMFLSMGYNVLRCPVYLPPFDREILRPDPGGKIVDLSEALSYEPIVVVSWQMEDWPEVLDYAHNGGRVIWRSVGQSNPQKEKRIAMMRQLGVDVVRYSPMERLLEDYAGEDILIRFAKDPNQFLPWNGEVERVLNFTVWMEQRRHVVGWAQWYSLINSLKGDSYGPGKRSLNFEDQLKVLSDYRVFLYLGSKPAPYTLGFIEAWMAGIPVVATGRRESHELSEIPDLICSGKDGYVSDDKAELIAIMNNLLKDKALAYDISIQGRQRAIAEFGLQKISALWNEILG